MSAIVEIKNLSGGYQKGVRILQGVSLTIERSEVLGIIGLNGSGKSTLGKAVINLIPYRSGVVDFEGEDVSRLTTSELSRKGIAMMQQGGVVFPTLSVYDNLQVAFRGENETEYVRQLKNIIPLLGKNERFLRHTMADKLSGGERHQLALAMTLASQPKLVILDEPSAGLSPTSVDGMYRILAKVKELFGLTIMLIEQNVTRAVDFSSRCVMLGQGVIIEEYKNKDIIEIEKRMFEQIT